MRQISKLLLPALLVVCACAADPGTDGAGGTAAAGGADATDSSTTSSTAAVSTTEVSTISSGGAGGGCHDVLQDAPLVTPSTSITPLPVPEGGAITDGRYHLTSCVLHFDYPPLPPTQTTLEIHNGTVEDTTDFEGTQTRSVSVISTHGAILEFSDTCGAGWGNAAYTYTATPEELVLIDGGHSVVMTFARVD